MLSNCFILNLIGAQRGTLRWPLTSSDTEVLR